MLIGLGFSLFGVNPIAALVFAAVFNGVAAVLLIWIIGSVAADRRVTGSRRSGWLSRLTIWLTFIGMAASAAVAIIALVRT
jgi:Mn2+/Fe2+ NRAMP family transporter